MSRFRRELIRRRKEAGHSQRFLADAIGTYVVKISRLENGMAVRLTNDQLATIRSLYGDMPAYDVAAMSENVLHDELVALNNTRALVVDDRHQDRFASALSLVEQGIALKIHDEMVLPKHGPTPSLSARQPYRRIMLVLAKPEAPPPDAEAFAYDDSERDYYGRDLKIAREAAGHSQDDLARLIDCDPDTIRRVEAGAHESEFLRFDLDAIDDLYGPIRRRKRHSDAWI